MMNLTAVTLVARTSSSAWMNAKGRTCYPQQTREYCALQPLLDMDSFRHEQVAGGEEGLARRNLAMLHITKRAVSLRETILVCLEETGP